MRPPRDSADAVPRRDGRGRPGGEPWQAALAQPHPRPRRSRRLAVTAVALVAVLAAGGFALDRLAGAGGGPASTDGGPVGGGASPLADPEARDAGPPPPARRPDAPFPAAAPATKAPVLSLPGDIPDRGPGSFRFATGRSEVWGDAGPVRRFRLAVEDGVPENLTALAGFVDATLSHPQGWAAGGDLRLRRVPEGAGHDFTIYLATSATVARMCAEVGLDVVGRGLPEGGVSCRTPGRAILNLHRWRLSVPEYVAGEIPLETYRRMLLNHEVGHELGHGHVACPGAGEPAPVMQQQTLGLDGCTANPWPYLDGRRHTGAPTS